MDVSAFTGSGFTFLQSQLLKFSDKEHDVSDDTTDHPEHEATQVSESATVLLMNLLKQENVNLTNHPRNTLVSRQHPSPLKKKIILPGMTEETKLSLAYDHEISLLGSMLYVIDQNHQNYSKRAASVSGGGISSSTAVVSGSVSTKSILQQCAYTVIPQKTPALLSAREMVCAALHFLCQECPIQKSPSLSESIGISTSPISIQLPLIQSTSMSSDIERRSYEKAYDWNFNTILPEILLLEHEFYNNFIIPSERTSDSGKNQNPLMWLPREFLVPDIKDDQLLRRIYIQGSLPSVPVTNDSKKSNKKIAEKSKSKVPSKNVTPTTKNPNGGTSVTKSIHIKRKQPSTTPKLSTKLKEYAETDITQGSGAAVKKIKITMSSSMKSSLTSRNSAVPMSPAKLDHVLATEMNQMLDDDGEDEQEQET
jgi:hypothetical protein